MDPKRKVFEALENSISKFLYYDRKEDDDLNVEQFKQAVRRGDITLDEMVDYFTNSLIEYFGEDLRQGH